MKKKRSREAQLLEKVVNPEQWYSALDSDRWLLTPQTDGSLLLETQGPYGLFTCRIHDPEKFAAKMLRDVAEHYKQIADFLEWPLLDFQPNILAGAESALHLFMFAFGDILLDTINETVEESLIKSGMIGDGLMVADYNRLGVPVGLTESYAEQTRKFIEKVSKKRRARLSQVVSVLPDLSKGSNLARQAEHLIENTPPHERLTLDTLAARLTERYEYDPPIDGHNLGKLLRRYGVKLRRPKRDK